MAQKKDEKEAAPIITDADINTALKGLEKDAKESEAKRLTLLAYFNAKNQINNLNAQITKSRKELQDIDKQVDDARAAHTDEISKQQKELDSQRSRWQADMDREKQAASAEIDKLKKEQTDLGKRVRTAESTAKQKIDAAETAAAVAESESKERVAKAEAAASEAEKKRDKAQRTLAELLREHNLGA